MYYPQRYRQVSLSWLPAYTNLDPPLNAIEAEPGTYIIRGRKDNDVLPGKWPIHLRKGYVPYGGEEIELQSFEVLCNTSLDQSRPPYTWIQCQEGNVPPNALQGGMTSNGEPLFIAKRYVNNEISVGKVHPSHRCAYFPWGGKEESHHHYEVLCFGDSS